MRRHFLRDVGYPVLVISLFLLNLVLLFLEARNSDWHDFDVFYGAASAALAGKSIYIIVGQYHLPFWYPPWTAWFYVPYAIWPKHTALLLYQTTLAAGAILVVHFLTRYYKPKFRILDELLILAMLVPMSVQLVQVGQMDYLFLALVVLIVWAASRKNDVLVALLFPFLLTKPHLIVPFTAMLFWRLGKRALLLTTISTALLLILATILMPHWYLEMLAFLRVSGERTAGLPFTTLPTLLGRQENWLGTANVPLSLLITALALLVLWKVRHLSTVPLLSVALALSLLSAPRAYAYDLPMLVPAMVWLTADNFLPKAWIWIAAALIPMVLGFSSSTYMVTMAVCLLATQKAFVVMSRESADAPEATAAVA